jgi:hypothetical protein
MSSVIIKAYDHVITTYVISVKNTSQSPEITERYFPKDNISERKESRWLQVKP